MGTRRGVSPYSSVVEHPLSKRKVGSSILLGGMSFCPKQHATTVHSTVPPLSSKCSHSFCTFTSPPVTLREILPPATLYNSIKQTEHHATSPTSQSAPTCHSYNYCPILSASSDCNMHGLLCPTIIHMPCPHEVDAARRRVVGLLLVTTNIYYGSVIYENRDSETSME